MESKSLLLIFIFVSQSGSIQHGKSLRAGFTLFNQVLYNGRYTMYNIHDLEPKTSYEVRVSYPAVIPTDFVIKVVFPGRPNERKLLNIEKTVFQTGDTVEEYSVEVRAYRTGVPLDPERLKDPVVYNIIVERLYLGLTFESWKLGLIGLTMLVGIWYFLVPLMHSQIIAITTKCHTHDS